MQAVGGLDRRGERVEMWIIPSEAVYAPFYVSSRGYGMWIEGTHPGTYDIGVYVHSRVSRAFDNVQAVRATVR